MISELLLQKKKINRPSGEAMRTMVNKPELSLGNLTTDSLTKPSRKRKSSWEEPPSLALLEQQLKDPRPLDWEQRLDLQSGRMYYLNKKTLKRRWSWPKNHPPDLELNISLPEVPEEFAGASLLNDKVNSMVAVACLRCHLLVMLSTTSPSCPNCHYVHSLQPSERQPKKEDRYRPLETLSLLN